MSAGSGYKYNNEVARRLAGVRKARGISQLTAARALGTTQSNISQFECGKRRLSSETVIALCRLYGVSANDVFGDLVSTEPRSSSPGEAETLLRELAEASGSSETAEAVDAYILLCAYRLFRELYELNPHNSQSIFAVPKERADALCEEFIREEPGRLRSLLSSGSSKVRSGLELPVERSEQLRRFIAACERLLTDDTGC